MKLRFSIVFKLMLFVGMLLGAITAALTWYQYKVSANEIEERFGLALKHVAITGVLAINGNDHMKIVAPGDENKPEFKRIKKQLFDIMSANNLSIETIYTFRITEGHKLAFAVMLHKKPFVGSLYNIPEINHHLFMRVFQGEAVHTPVYTDEHGSWISGLAPIVSNGKAVTGILEVDFRVETYLTALKAQVKTTLLIGAAVLLIALAIMFFIALKIARPIKDLRSAALRIIKGDYNIKILINTRDEIGELEKVFSRMVNSLSERFLMLKYISPHTQRRIEKQIHSMKEVGGEIRDVIIFFSDIRGFTKFSEQRQPEEVINTLNGLLDLQVRIIQKHGGEIDKFVGDEIVAVWNGDGREPKALAAALEIQSILGTAAIQVGIGIAGGEVIFGDIGSADRRDHTMIGSNVNLTARICAAAEPGQILVSSHFYYYLQTKGLLTDDFIVTLKEAITLKGFSQPVPLYSVKKT